MKTRTLMMLVLTCCQAQLDSPVEEEEEHVELFTTPTTKMAAAASDFGYNLFRALASAEPSGSNVFLAPLGVSAALTQLAMGGSQWSRQQLFRTLRYHRLQDPQLHRTFSDLLVALRRPDKGLSLAARVYLARRLRLKADFLSQVEQQLGVRPKQLSGGSRDLKEINEWVSQATGAKVARFLSRPLKNPSVSAVSAAYFKGTWSTRFSSSGASEDFLLDGAAPVRVPMMHQDNYPLKMGVDSDLSCTIAQIQMADDVSAFFFLPDAVTSNLTAVEESLSAEFVQDLALTLRPARASVSLPSIRVNYFTDLLPLMDQLGLTDWLADPQLEEISAQGARLSAVSHRVVMELAPEGNQYPGGPAGPAGPDAAPPAPPLTYRVDRPFLLLVRDEPSGALMFIGRVVNPKDLRK